MCPCEPHGGDDVRGAGAARFYLGHGRASAERLIESFSWSRDRAKRCLDAIEFHHRLTSQWDLGVEVELLRLADLVDASRGVVTLGLDQTWLRSLFRAIQRRGLQAELLRHGLRGAPCLTRGLIGTVINAPRRSIRSETARSPQPTNEGPHRDCE